MTFFEVNTYSGAYTTRTTAHDEANSYRPDLWVKHLFGRGQDGESGVKRTTRLFNEAGIEIRQEATA